MEPLVIIAAVNGGYQVSDDVARVPLSPQEVAEEAARCREAGASIVHFHGREPDGSNTPDVEYYRETMRLIRKSSDILIQTTNGVGVRRDKQTGALVRPTDEQRLALLNIEPRPDLFGTACGSTDFTHPHGGSSLDRPFVNSREWLTNSIRRAHSLGTTIEFEVVHLTALYRLREIAREGVFDPNASYLWLLHAGGIAHLPGDARLLVAAVEEGRRVFPNAKVGVMGAGPYNFTLAATGLAMGCHTVRIGLEDSLFRADGSRARTSAEMIKDAAELCRFFRRRPATPAEACEILELKRSAQSPDSRTARRKA
jgi:3-keto-5-aminohexanoate cleavage enzyme